MELKKMKNKKLTIEYIKKLGKERTENNLDELLEYYGYSLDIDLKREIVSSIGRNKNNDRVYDFLINNAFNDVQMELIYQMYRTCLYKGKDDNRFLELGLKYNKVKVF